MKLTLEISDEDLRGEGREALVALLGGSVLLSLLDNDMVQTRGREQARQIHAEKNADGDKPETEEEAKPRAYGEATGKRRTKEEKALDDEIEALFEKVKDQPGMPKKIPTDQPAEALLEELRNVAASVGDDGDEQEEGFDVAGGDEDESDEEILDLEEFRAIIVKHSKTIGGATLSGIMAPYKNPKEVPEADRRHYADKIIEAAENAS
jgi:hypothetical protein